MHAADAALDEAAEVRPEVLHERGDGVVVAEEHGQVCGLDLGRVVVLAQKLLPLVVIKHRGELPEALHALEDNGELHEVVADYRAGGGSHGVLHAGVGLGWNGDVDLKFEQVVEAGLKSHEAADVIVSQGIHYFIRSYLLDLAPAELFSGDPVHLKDLHDAAVVLNKEGRLVGADKCNCLVD